jgi:hypothetical protein
MEDFFLNIDSRYRDIATYPNESKFKYFLNRMYKNVMSVKFMSIELVNTVSYIDTFKNNNYITFHFPTFEQDPIGFVYTFPEGFYNAFPLLATTINDDLMKKINVLSAFEQYAPERYFYIFYLNKPTTITILTYNYILNSGWYSLYGVVLLLTKYINSLGITDFTIQSFTLSIQDKRLPSINPNYHNTREDIIPTIVCNTGNLNTNLNTMKTSIYSEYINDTTNFIAGNGESGILDRLVRNTYAIEENKGYILAGNITSGSKYYTNNSNTIPSQTSSQLYNFNIFQSPTSTKTIINSASCPFFIYEPISSTWIPLINPINDLPIFELNIATNSVQSLGFSYPSVGYYMGFRQTLQRSSNLMLVAEKLGNYIGDPYIFVRMNGWGHVDIFNEKMFAKVLLTPDLGLVKLDEFYSKEFKFKQPQNVHCISIELIDYLGHTLDLRGLDFSFTLQLSQINNSELKKDLEYNFFDKKK